MPPWIWPACSPFMLVMGACLLCRLARVPPQQPQQVLAPSQEQLGSRVPVQQQEPPKAPSGQELQQDALPGPSSQAPSAMGGSNESPSANEPPAQVAEPAWSPQPALGKGQCQQKTTLPAATEPSDLSQEWGLTLAQQKEQPFHPPDLSSLGRPVPIVFDLETTGM